MEKFFRNKQELIFWLITAFLAVVTLILLYYSLIFLLANISQTFSGGLIGDEEIVKFKLDQIERLK